MRQNMAFMALKSNGHITNSLRFKEIDNQNILRCLTEHIGHLDNNFTLHSVYLMLKKYPILCSILDTPDLYSPSHLSPVKHFMSFFKGYKGEFIEPNFMNTAYIHQIIALSKSDYQYKFKNMENLSEINNIKPEKLNDGFKYLFDSQYELSINISHKKPSSENQFSRRGLSKKDIGAMKYNRPIRVAVGNILYFYSESKLKNSTPTKLVSIEESADDVIQITLIDFLETIVSKSLVIQ